MFQGTIPSQMRGYVAEMVQAWGVTDLYNGCSGNFTIARSIPGIRHHGNDVTIYSCALGWWGAGEPVPLTLKPESEEALGWMKPYLDTPDRTIATMMLCTRFLEFVGKDHAYARRMLKATHDQWERMHAQTLAKVEASTLDLASFAAMDVNEWLSDAIPKDAPFVSFPPFFANGYEVMWKPLEDHFDWPEPDYPIMGDKEKQHLIDVATDRPHWFLGLHDRWPTLDHALKGVMQTTAHGVPIWFYASDDSPKRAVTPRQATTPVHAPRITAATEWDGTEKVTLAPLAAAQFNHLRAQYLDTRIAPAAPAYAWAVLVNGDVAGAIAFKAPENKFGAFQIYMLSDFPIAPSRYQRLAPLIAMCAQSTEVKQLLERATNRRLEALTTTAFTDNQVSMKYRTAHLALTGRRVADNGVHSHQLQYEAPLGRWTLAEAYAEWWRKHSKHQAKGAA